MKDNDLEKYLRDISSQTARTDERTLEMQKTLVELKVSDDRQDEDIDELRSKVNKHDLMLGGFGAALLAGLSGFITKFTNLF